MKTVCPQCGLQTESSRDTAYCFRCGSILSAADPEWRAPRVNEDSKLYKVLATMKGLGGMVCQLVILAIALNFVTVVATGNYLFRIYLNMAVFLFLTGLVVGSIGHFGVEEMDDHECDSLPEWLATHKSMIGGGAVFVLLYAMAVVRLW